MNIPQALTYDDVLLVPKKSTISSRSQVNTTTKISRNLGLKIPLVSANMDTVTESQMAIAMALSGGLGVIHRFCDVTRQAREVARVKRKQNIVIDHPFTVSPEENLAAVKAKIIEHNCKSFLVSDRENNLLGILTNRDIKFVKDEQTLVRDMMTAKEKLITARDGISPEAAKELLTKHKIEKLPLVDENFKIKGLITAADFLNHFNNNQAAKDNKGRLLVGAAIGVRGDYMERVDALVKAEVDLLVLDIAHGHSEIAIKAIKEIKTKYPQMELVGGNVATREGAEDLIQAGVDAIKVGIGSGSICTTRTTTGFGVPQLTAIMNASQSCRKHNIPLIADSGIRKPADIVKALAAGADTVMIGGQFAGTDEAPGPIITYQGRRYKISRGMASLTAALSRPDAKENLSQITPEGIEARVPYRGPVQNIIDLFMGGLRSGMSYGNAQTIAELREHAEFIQITAAGSIESGSHDNELL
ncbi:MAG: IMP dehydrogenase [Parcubacteria group bacterium]|nr:MAG: IMP dehydrogenase [Parcubacteria group bacterium]